LVENIITRRIVEQKGDRIIYQYLIKWTNYSHEYNTWEPGTRLENIDPLLEYISHHPMDKEVILSQFNSQNQSLSLRSTSSQSTYPPSLSTKHPSSYHPTLTPSTKYIPRGQNNPIFRSKSLRSVPRRKSLLPCQNKINPSHPEIRLQTPHQNIVRTVSIQSTRVKSEISQSHEMSQIETKSWENSSDHLIVFVGSESEIDLKKEIMPTLQISSLPKFDKPIKSAESNSQLITPSNRTKIQRVQSIQRYRTKETKRISPQRFESGLIDQDFKKRLDRSPSIFVKEKSNFNNRNTVKKERENEFFNSILENLRIRK